MSYTKIATALGVSESLVAKELKRPGNLPIADDGSIDTGSILPLPNGSDPELQAANAAVAAERLELQRLELRAKRMELERRMQLFENPGQGNNGALLAQLVDSQLSALRAEIARIQTRPAQPAAPVQPPASDLEVLERAHRTQQLFNSLAPAKGPTTAAELELQTALDRLNMEREERMRKLDADLEERRTQLANDRIRQEAFARQIDSWGPLIAQGFQTWVANQGPAAAAAAGAPAGGGAVSVLTPGQIQTGERVEGPCPSCGVQLRIVGTGVEHCPSCQTEIVAVEGQIRRTPPVRRNAPLAS